MAKIGTDLHYHGPIGFEPTWLKAQGYEGKNVLRLMADAALNRHVGIAAVISETDKVGSDGRIIPGSLHDRIGFMRDTYLQDLDSHKKYSADMLGDNSIVVYRGDERVIFLSGMTPIINERGKRYDHLIISSNQVPNFLPLEETIAYANEQGLPNGLEHPSAKAHFGVGFEKGLRVLDQVDFVEGHNAQMTWPTFFAKVPVVGDFTRARNEQAKDFADAYDKSWIATSDAHRIQDIGLAQTLFEEDALDCSSEEKLIASLKNNIRGGNFYVSTGYVPAHVWLSWGLTFKSHAAKAEKEALEAIQL